MGLEGFSSSSKWPGSVRLHHSKSGNSSNSEKNDEGKGVQPAEVASGRKSILLHDWWLVKADLDSHGKRLGIGGYTLEEKQAMRSFFSASTTLQTVDGITIMVHGYLNTSRTLENGFSQEVCDHFQIGFPYYWEDFAALSVSSEEPGYSSASKGFSPSDACKTPTQEARGTNMTSGNIFVASSVIQSTDSPEHRTTSARAGGGPLTRSRSRAQYYGPGWIWE